MKSIVLDDGIEYIIVDTKTIDGTSYTLFSNVNDITDVCLRKTEIIDDVECYVGLDNDQEIDKVLLYFAKENLK